MGNYLCQSCSISMYTLLIYVVLLLNARVGSCGSCYKRIFSFGDSIIDSGNFVHAIGRNPSPIKEPPFGMTFFHHPNGRVSDGRVIIDFYAQAFQLSLVPPSLPEKDSGQFPFGANFAMFAATALPPEYFRRRKCPVPGSAPLGMQMGSFREVLQRIAPGDGTKKLLSESLILLGEIGGNDYNFWFFNSGQAREIAFQIMPDVVATIRSTAQELINLGAKTIVVPGNFPIGCVPEYLSRFHSGNPADYDEFHCLRWYNEFVMHHNLALSNEVNVLRSQHPGVKLIYADYYGAAMEFIKNPNRFGMGDPKIACCGGNGPYHTGKVCDKNGILWGNPANFASWDGIHMTEKAYHAIADGVLYGPHANPPLMHSC